MAKLNSWEKSKLLSQKLFVRMQMYFFFEDLLEKRKKMKEISFGKGRKIVDYIIKSRSEYLDIAAT
jgi:hypothetical protein